MGVGGRRGARCFAARTARAKSTLPRILSGITAPDAGGNLSGGPCGFLERAGIGAIPQELDLFGNLSVAESAVSRVKRTVYAARLSVGKTKSYRRASFPYSDHLHLGRWV